MYTRRPGIGVRPVPRLAMAVDKVANFTILQWEDNLNAKSDIPACFLVSTIISKYQAEVGQSSVKWTKVHRVLDESTGEPRVVVLESSTWTRI